MIRRATRADAEALATLHAASLPTSLLSLLGRGALVRYYRYLAESSHELVWVTEEDGGVVAGCVLSHQPRSMLRRFARLAPLQLARETAVQAMRDRELRIRLARRLRDPRDRAHEGKQIRDTAPEVTQIFTDGKLRGKGLGAELLRTCEETLRTRSATSYFVHTQRDDNDAGIRFYLREGFVTIGESRSFGEAFLVMQKVLD